MRSMCSFVLVALCLAACASPARGEDERELIKQFNQIVGHINAGRMNEAQQSLDDFEKKAKAIPQGDAAFERAQELLKNIPELRKARYRNGALAAEKNAREQLIAGEAQTAREQFAQAAADLRELLKLEPQNDQINERLKDLVRQAEQTEWLFKWLNDDISAALPAAAADAVVPLQTSAPSFGLPVLQQPQMIWPLQSGNGPLVIDLWSARDPSLPLAAKILRSLPQLKLPVPVRTLAVVIDDGNDLTRIQGWIQEQRPEVEIALDDLAEFRGLYLANGVAIPAYVVITGDRRAYYVRGQDRLQAIAEVARLLQTPFEAPETTQYPEPYFARVEPFAVVGISAESNELSFADKPTMLLVANAGVNDQVVTALRDVAGEFGATLRRRSAAVRRQSRECFSRVVGAEPASAAIRAEQRTAGSDLVVRTHPENNRDLFGR
jgi:hypothetical protein